MPPELDEGSEPRAREERERAKEELFGEYVDRLNGGEILDADQIRSDHPELADELVRELKEYEAFALTERDEEVTDRFAGYRIVRLLGRGGTGRVYEAIEETTEQRVALKVLYRELVFDKKAILRFRREARIVSQLRHSAIVTLHNMGFEGGTPYIAFEFVVGTTLSRLLEQTPEGERGSRFWSLRSALDRGRASRCERESEESSALSSGCVRKVESLDALDVPSTTDDIDSAYSARMADAFAGVAAGLHHAHSKGVVHRDIKPSNLILDEDGGLRILDFGLARFEGQDTITRTGEVLGTPLYMSPEQVKGGGVEVDYRSDIYSLGATLYQVLTLRPPFEVARNREATSRLILDRDPPSLRLLNPRVPRDLEAVVLHCLEKDPNRRYRTAEALAQDLRRSARGDLVEVRTPSTGEKILRAAKRHRRRIAVGIAALLIVAAFGLLTHRNRQLALVNARQDYDESVLHAVARLQATGVLTPAVADILEAPVGFGIEGLGFSLVSRTAVEEVARETIPELERATRALPERPEAPYYLARALLLLGDDDTTARARRELTRAHRLGFVPATALRRAVFGVDEVASAEEGSWQQSWDEAQRAIWTHDWRAAAAAYQRLGEHLRRGKEPFLGAKLDIFLACGIAHAELRDFEEAKCYFQRAMGVRPQAVEPELLFGIANHLQGDEREAEGLFEELFERSPDTACLLAAFHASRCGDFARGLRWADRIVDPYTRESMKAGSLVPLGQWEEAAEAGYELVRLRPDHALGYLVLGLAHHRGGHGRAEDLEKAVAFADRASEAPHPLPERSVPCLLEAWALAFQARRERRGGDFASARAHDAESLEALRAIRELDPAPIVQLSAGGASYWMHHRPHDAVEWIEPVRKRASIGPQACVDLGLAYRDTGRPEEAMELLLEAGRSLGRLSGRRTTQPFMAVTAPLTWSPVSAFHALAPLLLRMDRPDYGARVEEIIDAFDGDVVWLERNVRDRAERAVKLRFARMLQVLACLYEPGSAAKLDRALSVATESMAACREAGESDPMVAQLLAMAQFAKGDRAAAIHTLERHLWHEFPCTEPARCEQVARRLEEYTRAARPDLPTFGSIDRALASIDRQVLVGPDAPWSLLGARCPGGVAWASPVFDASRWGRGFSGFGIESVDSAPYDRSGAATPVVLRHQFSVENPSRYERLILSVLAYDDCTAILNGTRILEEGPAEPQALSGVPKSLRTLTVTVPGGLLRNENLLAIRGIDRSSDPGFFLLRPVLEGELIEAAVREEEGRLLEGYRVASGGECPGARLAYLRGRILQRRGEHGEAAALFAAARRHDPEQLEPCLRLAECRSARRPGAEVEQLLREVLAACPGQDGPTERALWSSWVRTALLDRGESAVDALQHLPGGAQSARYRTGVHWLLERLARGEPIRIDCGAVVEGTPSKEGAAWGPDVFFDGGFAAGGPLPGSSSNASPEAAPDRVYRTIREFAHRSATVPAYRVPLARGVYRVTLHFAELEPTASLEGSGRSFDVVIEGDEKIPGYGPPVLAGPFEADVHSFRVAVLDGSLGVELVPRVGNPCIAAIEVAPADPRGRP